MSTVTLLGVASMDDKAKDDAGCVVERLVIAGDVVFETVVVTVTVFVVVIVAIVMTVVRDELQAEKTNIATQARIKNRCLYLIKLSPCVYAALVLYLINIRTKLKKHRHHH